MKLILTAIIATLFLANAESALIFNANKSMQCPKKIKVNFGGKLVDVSIIPSKRIVDGLFIEAEENKIHEFLNKWFNHFTSNNDTPATFNSLCFGMYDESSIGESPNAFAAGSNLMLIGTDMISSLKHKKGPYLKTLLERNYGKLPKTFETTLNSVNSEDMINFLFLHELSHTLQKLNNYNFTNYPAKVPELQADCAAGFMFTMDLYNKNKNIAQAMFSGMLYAQALGDHHVKSTTHHGTPAETECFLTRNELCH